MIRKIMVLALGISAALHAQGQQKSDTVVVPLAKTSKIIFTMEDRSDLEILKHYNFQELFNDIIVKLENKDTVVALSEPAENTTTSSEETHEENSNEGNWSSNSSYSSNDRDDDDDDDEDWNERVRVRHYKRGRTSQSFNFDLGTNNYLSDGKFKDDLSTVRPWGSWYVAGSSIQRTRVGRNFFAEWGLGISWYNFKFQQDDVMLQKTDDGVEFIEDLRDVNHRKSKLTATYLNASFVPVLDFGDHSRKPRMWDGYRSSFRIGIGPYVGYRIGSRTKMVFKDDGNLEKEKERDSFYMNNIRYGARLQLGFYGTDLFFNYDMNELFRAGKGPKLNAFSFGVIF